jgi:DNA invertase Pin-like site-specific DNA recombinase
VTEHVPQRAVEYLRVSQDRSGEMESPAQQHQENERHAARHGWSLGDAYAEAGAVSASRYSGKARDEFKRLLADLESGAFAAEVLILWESSRGSRKVGEWVTLIEDCEAAGVLIYVTTHAKAYDPAEARDRRTLLEDAVDSEWESAKISKRVRRAMAANAAAGKPHGAIPFGYVRTYDPVTRALVAQEKHPAEAPLVAELLARLHAGQSLKSVEADWKARGVLTRGSKRFPPRPFTAEHLRDVALRACYAGLRVHQPGKGSGRRPGATAETVQGTWPAIVEPDVWHAVQALLTDPARRTSRPGGAKHLLSLIAVCGKCGGPLTVGYRDGRYYFCRDGSHVRIRPADDLDEVAEEAVVGFLSRPGTGEMFSSAVDVAPELARVRAEAETRRATLAEWQHRAAKGEVSPASFAAIEPPILAEVTRLEYLERRMSAPSALEGWAGPEAEVRARWGSAALGTRRTVLRALQPYMGILTLVSVSRGHWVPASKRVRWAVWGDDDDHDNDG